VLEVHLLIGDPPANKDRRLVYRGNKDAVLADIDNITHKVQDLYDNL
jgi:hypothetical protein